MALELDRAQQREFRKMLLTIKNNSQKTGLLIAVCDDRNLQSQLIETYEAELEEAGVLPFRVRLDPKQPSVRRALQELVNKHQELAEGSAAVATVMNANELLGVRLTEEKSEQEKFFFSLQWTREALLRFEFPIVIWLTDQVATRLSQQAPDFWSWRTGFFEFLAPEPVPTPAPSPYQGESGGEVIPEFSVASLDACSTPELTPLTPPAFSEHASRKLRGETGADADATNRLSVADVQAQITSLESIAKEQGTADSPLLITLYNELGDAHGRDYKYKLALEAYEKALELAWSREDKAGEARSLFNIANALRLADRPAQSIEFYEKALAFYHETGDFHLEAFTLVRMGVSYELIGEYPKAISLYQTALDIQRNIDNPQAEASTLRNLGLAHHALGNYQKAKAFHERDLKISRSIGDLFGEAAALSNLGMAFKGLEQYQNAIEILQESLIIIEKVGFPQAKANALINLGNAFNALKDYEQAINFYHQSLFLNRKLDNRWGEANALGNLGRVYRNSRKYNQAIKFFQESILIQHEIDDRHGEADSTYSLGFALARVDKKWEAKIAFEQARTLYEAMGLEKDVKICDAAIRDLSRQTVAIPMKTPTIGEKSPQVPDWWEKSLPTAEASGESNPSKPWKMPLWGWLVLGVVVVVAIGWRLGF